METVDIIVKYEVTGDDHDGYCSGAEGSPIEPYFEYSRTHFRCSPEDIDEKGFLKNISWLKNSSGGCSNESGSGYCTGCFINYNPVWAKVEDKETTKKYRAISEKLGKKMTEKIGIIDELRKSRDKEITREIAEHTTRLNEINRRFGNKIDDVGLEIERIEREMEINHTNNYTAIEKEIEKEIKK